MPPYNIMEGRFNLPIAITEPGIFLSLCLVCKPTYRNIVHRVFVSILSGDRCHGLRGYKRMPSVPRYRSTPIVWKNGGPAGLLYCYYLTVVARVVGVHIAGVTIPTHAGDAHCAFAKSFASLKPIAYWACAAGWVTSRVSVFEYCSVRIYLTYVFVIVVLFFARHPLRRTLCTFLPVAPIKAVSLLQLTCHISSTGSNCFH